MYFTFDNNGAGAIIHGWREGLRYARAERRNGRPSLRQAIADARREVESSPPWLKTIYERNRATDLALRSQQAGGSLSCASLPDSAAPSRPRAA